MKKSVIIWLIIATVLTVVGACIFAVSMAAVGWNFSFLDTENYETNVHTIEDDFESIDLEVDTTDVTFKLSEDGTCRVECFEAQKRLHTVKISDGTLYIRSSDQRKWYEHIGFFSRSTKVTVYLNRSNYEKLSVKSSTGDISLESELAFDSVSVGTSTGSVLCKLESASDMKISASTGSIKVIGTSMSSLDVSVTTGYVLIQNANCQGKIDVEGDTSKVSLCDVTCDFLEVSVDTGNVTLTDTVAQSSFDIETDTGKVEFQQCDANNITVEMDTGDVFGTLLSEKVFIASSDTGDIRVPYTEGGGVCRITTDTGDITISIVQAKN